jgi:hypothetical protein
VAGNTKRIVIGLLVLLLAVGASDAVAATTTYDANGTILIDGRKVFPIGLALPPPLGATTPSGVDGLNEVTDAGVTMLRAGPFGAPFTDEVLAATEEMNRAAAARGVHTWVNLRELARAQPGTPEDAMLAKVVTTLADDPGLALWNGAGEPWWVGWDWPSLTYAYCSSTSRGDATWCDKTLARDRLHLWVTIQAPRGTAADLAPYSAVTDVHGVNIYPVGFGVQSPDLHQVGTWTKLIESVTPNRVVWTTLQICFSGSDDPTIGQYVLPTREQERYMIYDAILNGARALNFFGGSAPVCHSPLDAAHGWNWTFWETVLEGLVREIGPRSALYPALLEPGSALPVSSNDPTTQITTRQAGGSLWVVAARHGPGTATVQIGGVPLDGVTGEVYTEGRSVPVTGGTITDTFSQWGVHVYRFPSSVAGLGTWISSGPTGVVRDRAAVLAFGGSGAQRFQCSLDGAAFTRCSSPVFLESLPDGEHRFRVRAVDARGRADATPAVRAWIVDTGGPTRQAVSPLPRFQRSVTFRVPWSASDPGTGVAAYDVRYREASSDAGFGPHVAWQSAVSTTSARLRGRLGSTYCFSVRATDRVGNASGWGKETCTAVPLDDRELAPSGRWTRRSGIGYYVRTYSVSAARGAALVARGVRARRLSLLVRRCPRCGTARIIWNGVPVRTVSLAGPDSRTTAVVEVASFARARTGRVAVRVTTRGKRVVIDGLGVSAR